MLGSLGRKLSAPRSPVLPSVLPMANLRRGIADDASKPARTLATRSGRTAPASDKADQQRGLSTGADGGPPSRGAVRAALKRVWRGYLDQLAARPLATKAVTCFVGGVIGDALAQTTTGLPFDVARNLRLSAFGLVFGGPAGHYWHRTLDARVFPAAPHSPAAVLSKLAVDQLLFAPFATALLFAFLKVAEGVPEAALSFVAENWWRTLKANWMLWPAANLVAFAAIPADLRILFANGIGVLWCMYVSISCSAPGAGPPPPPLDKLE